MLCCLNYAEDHICAGWTRPGRFPDQHQPGGQGHSSQIFQGSHLFEFAAQGRLAVQSENVDCMELRGVESLAVDTPWRCRAGIESFRDGLG